MFSVIERASGEWVGRLGPWEPDGWPAPEIGYGVSARFAGKGYAFEGAVAACDFAVEFLKWPELMHSIDPANTRSQALAKRLGATNSGRSEEHTSELQSLMRISYAVFCLKKKTTHHHLSDPNN